MSAKRIHDMSRPELQALIKNRNEPMPLRNRATRRLRELQRETHGQILGRLKNHYGHPSPHE